MKKTSWMRRIRKRRRRKKNNRKRRKRWMSRMGRGRMRKDYYAPFSQIYCLKKWLPTDGRTNGHRASKNCRKYEQKENRLWTACY